MSNLVLCLQHKYGLTSVILWKRGGWRFSYDSFEFLANVKVGGLQYKYMAILTAVNLTLKCQLFPRNLTFGNWRLQTVLYCLTTLSNLFFYSIKARSTTVQHQTLLLSTLSVKFYFELDYFIFCNKLNIFFIKIWYSGVYNCQVQLYKASLTAVQNLTLIIQILSEIFNNSAK